MAENSPKTDQPALGRPGPTDAGWQEKAEEARRAREMGRQLRAGKPASFRSAVGRHA